MDVKEDCFHLGVKAIIFNRQEKLLLLERQLHSMTTYWDMPGGRLQKGETMMEALRREVEEEVGLKNMVEITPFVMRLTNRRISLLDGDVGLIFSIYKCNVVSDFTPHLSNEHINFGWFDVSEAIQLLKGHTPELIEDLKKLRKFRQNIE